MRAAVPAAAIAASIGIGFAGITSAQVTTGSATTTPSGAHVRGMMDGRPAVVGKVASISGNSFTVTAQKPGDTSATTYTVDASSATVMKAAQGAAPATSSVSAIAVGDTVAVEGTVSGTSVTATKVMDGVMAFGGKRGPGGPGGAGQMGTVTAVNGTTVTITGKNGTTYTVDGANATVSKTSQISVGDIQVGDTIGVRGSVSGTTITAKDIMDGIPQKPGNQAQTGPTQQ